MRDGEQVLPPGQWKRVLAAVAAVLAGDLLVNVMPWPGSLLSFYEQAMIPAICRRTKLLWITLVLVPTLEEGALRLVLYEWLKRFMAFLPAAVISSLAFGIYHGNWIQGTYAFLLGMVLAWGYGGSEYRKYPMTVLMHGAANLAALAAFG